MKWETKDKLLKLGFICAITMMFLGIAISYQECQRDVVEKKWYGELSESKAL
jgi:hypothetical protein|tara:strand:+ start:692 stop:847 length:156 start_codon:yes stop_codon:yes gene_type:complete